MGLSREIPPILAELKKMKRAMAPFVLFLWEIVYESKETEVLEIGVRQAQSTRTILSAIKEKNSGYLTSIDLRDRTHRVPEDLAGNWKLIIGNSTKEDTLKQVSDKQYDILFIDGDHSYDGVKSDYEMYSPLVKEGGMIIFHDVINNNCGVPRFWDELKADYKMTLPFGIAGMGIIAK